MMRQRSPGSGTSGRALLAAPLVIALGACGSGGPGEALERTASWGASARMAAEARAVGATSRAYTRQALHVAHAELQQSTKSLGEALDAPEQAATLSPGQRARARADARTVERAVGEMARAADSAPGDVAILLRLAARADSAGRAARALSDSVRTR